MMRRVVCRAVGCVARCVMHDGCRRTSSLGLYLLRRYLLLLWLYLLRLYLLWLYLPRLYLLRRYLLWRCLLRLYLLRRTSALAPRFAPRARGVPQSDEAKAAGVGAAEGLEGSASKSWRSSCSLLCLV